MLTLRFMNLCFKDTDISYSTFALKSRIVFYITKANAAVGWAIGGMGNIRNRTGNLCIPGTQCQRLPHKFTFPFASALESTRAGTQLHTFFSSGAMHVQLNTSGNGII